MLEPWRGRRPRRAQLCSGAVVTVLSSPWQTQDVGTEEAVGTGTGIPPRAWGSVLKTGAAGEGGDGSRACSGPTLPWGRMLRMWGGGVALTRALGSVHRTSGPFRGPGAKQVEWGGQRNRAEPGRLSLSDTQLSVMSTD